MDYIGRQGTAIINAGDLSVFIEIPTSVYQKVEASQFIFKIISSNTGTTARSEAVVTINSEEILFQGVTSISGGRFHTCAILEQGAVKCWGQNFQGQLGNNSVNDSPIAVQVIGLNSGIKEVSSGIRGSSCALTDLGGVKCWGRNASNNDMVNELVPSDVIGLTAGVKEITTGFLSNCALLQTGGLKCWGSNVYGQLGNNGVLVGNNLTDPIGLTAGVAKISAGNNHYCALNIGGGVQCWGDGNNNLMGVAELVPAPTNQNLLVRLVPSDVFNDLTSGIRLIASGSRFNCVVPNIGQVKCWGNERGAIAQLFNINIDAAQVDKIEANGDQACILTKQGAIKCIDAGLNRPFSVGDINGAGQVIRDIATGTSHACAADSAGGVKCWGTINSSGQLGNNTTTPSQIPVEVLGLKDPKFSKLFGFGRTASITPKCIGCHNASNPTAGLDITDYNSILAKITPGNAENSILWQRISGAVAPRMPAGDAALSDADVFAVKQWIDAGALNN